MISDAFKTRRRQRRGFDRRRCEQLLCEQRLAAAGRSRITVSFLWWCDRTSSFVISTACAGMKQLISQTRQEPATDREELLFVKPQEDMLWIEQRW